MKNTLKLIFAIMFIFSLFTWVITVMHGKSYQNDGWEFLFFTSLIGWMTFGCLFIVVNSNDK